MRDVILSQKILNEYLKAERMNDSYLGECCITVWT